MQRQDKRRRFDDEHDQRVMLMGVEAYQTEACRTKTMDCVERRIVRNRLSSTGGRWSSSVALGALALATWMVPSALQAQAWRSDVQRTEGPGLRAGNLEFHPGVAVEGGYDSNVFYADEDPVGSALLRVSPHLDISTLGPQRRDGDGETDGDWDPAVEFRAGLSASYYKFFESRARDNVSVDANARLTILPQRPVHFSLFNNYARTIRPFADFGAVNRNFSRNRNESGGALEYRSRGDTLTASAGYSFMLDFFEGASFRSNDNYGHKGSAKASWRFLPSTSLVYDLDVIHSDFRGAQNEGFSLRSDQTSVATRVGLNGFFTPKLSALAMIGYGGAFIDSPLLSEYDNVLAQAELRWQIQADARLEIGYERDYRLSFIGGNFSRDRGYLRGLMMFKQVLSVGSEFWAGYLNYGRVIAPDGTPLSADGSEDRSDVVVSASLFAEYRMISWLALNTSVSYIGNFTDFEFAPGVGRGIVNAANYHKVEVWGGLRASY